MMPVIRIADQTASDLQLLATPLIDNYESVIRRLVDAALQGKVYDMPKPVIAPVTPQAATPFQVNKPYELTHTKVLDAKFGGKTISKANWNTLAKVAHEEAYQKLGSFDALRLATRAHVKPGRYEQEGFVYIPSGDFSLQGMDSNMSWDNSVRLAHEIGSSVEVRFEWRNTPKAQKPGQQKTLNFP